MRLFNDQEDYYTSSFEEDFVDEVSFFKETDDVLISPVPAVKKQQRFSPSGRLTPAIIEVLKHHRKPMKATEIFDALQDSGYVWATEAPMQSICARLRYMPKSLGVIRVNDNKYVLAKLDKNN